MALRRASGLESRSNRTRAALLAVAVVVAALLGWGLGSLTGGGSGSTRQATLAKGAAQGAGTIGGASAAVASPPSLHLKPHASQPSPNLQTSPETKNPTQPLTTVETTSTPAQVVSKPQPKSGKSETFTEEG
jgi:hypothetical protein